ncbi:large-conductance mechanosensitive channel protein MscL [Luteimonas yindakuii]|uniref:Large-conductance mechanosensitive channel n=1 Tax=Luteimonas yindakuii TaxID=2565782 RepID=A0A4Z1RFB8_9GAMM|nr:large-conductance mechanosensitive channel protein MscL [Luteimonas yindakuii]QCO67184.1 large-conductance mechanosensitive channel protein MscL [Luteimonas yindakuii]TKS53367.1 large-conductance mechanosensitive channel protein MscL [Luteimonas yindakuii]
MGVLAEFKEFAVRGNVIDLAVGVIIGASFGKIVTALVDNVIMPPIGLLIGGVDFADWEIMLRRETMDAAGEVVPAVTIGIGIFLNTLIQFVIVAFAIFLLVKFINRLKRKQAESPAEAPPPAEDVLLLREIRDALKTPPGRVG